MSKNNQLTFALGWLVLVLWFWILPTISMCVLHLPFPPYPSWTGSTLLNVSLELQGGFVSTQVG